MRFVTMRRLQVGALFMLDQIRPEVGSGWMFAHSIDGALDFDNLADRVIKPVLKANGLRWKGGHAYRRGLATNLHELGIPGQGD